MYLSIKRKGFKRIVQLLFWLLSPITVNTQEAFSQRQKDCNLQALGHAVFVKASHKEDNFVCHGLQIQSLPNNITNPMTYDRLEMRLDTEGFL